MKRIVCLGGGPAGLYSAILFRKALPRARVEVYERNRPDDTFGWGVVFSDRTMAGLPVPPIAPSHAAITGSFHHWDDIDVHYRGTLTTTGGHGFCGIERKRLLEHPAGAGRRARRPAPLPAGDRRRRAVRRCRPDRRGRRRQQPHAQALRGRVRAGHRHAQVPLHLARHDQAVPGLHVRVRGDRARLVPDPRLPVQQGSLDRHRRDARGDLARARPRPLRTTSRPSPSARSCSPATSTAIA